jgi:hypothetical protein
MAQGAVPCMPAGVCFQRLEGHPTGGDFHNRERGDLAIPYLYIKGEGGGAEGEE